MNHPIRLKTTAPPLLITLTLLCFGLLPKADAVVPAPDGGYPGFNTAEGQKALFGLTTGVANTAVGWFSLWGDTDGSYNTAVGAGTLLFNVGNQSTVEGAQKAGSFNTANGALALFSNTEASYNTAIGFRALFSNTIGGGNTANGHGALVNNISGNNNTADGDDALINNTTGNYNIALGIAAGSGVTMASNVICIGTDGNNVDNSCYIGQIFGATSSNGVAVFVNSNGRLGTMTSSARFKKDIKPMNHASDALYALKPITFRYKKQVDPEGTSAMQFGLVAEDVEKVSPDLVIRDREGKPYSVRYDQVNAMLLNEFLKEHSTVQELKKEVAALTAGLQKMSAQLEASKPAPQTVRNND